MDRRPSQKYLQRCAVCLARHNRVWTHDFEETALQQQIGSWHIVCDSGTLAYGKRADESRNQFLRYPSAHTYTTNRRLQPHNYHATMKFLTTSCLLATLSFASALADTAASPTISYLSTTSPTTSATTDSPDLELRQIGLVNPDAALTGVAGGGAVTNYQINSQVGPSAAENVAVVYTQTFAAVPDQWPSAKAGVIGLGDLAKRNVQAEPTVVEEARVLHTGIAGRIRR